MSNRSRSRGGGSRRRVIIGHDRPVAPAPEGGSGGGGRPRGPARGAPCPDRGPVPGGGGGPGGVPYAGGDARARRRPGTGRPGALGPGAGRALPSESTIRRVLQRVNADDLDARVSSWLRTRVGAIGGRRVIAVEDETMRGARGAGERATHLPAAPGRAGGVVVGQRRVADKSNEIPALRDLLAPLDLDGAVITADATAHPEGHGRVDHLPRRPLRAHRQGQPVRPEAGAGEAALEGRAGRVRPRRLPRAQGAAHHQSGRGARPGRLGRRRPGDPDQTHHNRQGEEARRGGPPGSAPFP